MDNSGTCNLNLPNSSVYARFIYIIRYLTRQGFYVIIDDHFNVDNLAQTNPGASPWQGPVHCHDTALLMDGPPCSLMSLYWCCCRKIEQFL